MSFVELNKGYKYNTLTYNMIKEFRRFLDVTKIIFSHTILMNKLDQSGFPPMIDKEYFL